jgi:2-methylcitrate dehydratase PrpD
MGLTRDIGAFVAGMRFESLPAGAVPIVCTGFTDCVGVLLAGLGEPVTQIVARGARASGLAYDPAAIARFDGAAAPAPELALLYGTAAHALDYDDTALSGHPSAVLVPAILAEAADTDADGRAMIAAYVAGYEVWAELIGRDADQHHGKGWHPSAVFGTVAAAAAASVLRRLDAAQATNAVALAASLAGGVGANFGTMTKPFQVARAAQSGLVAARLAAEGMTASDDALEHRLGFLHAFSPKGAVDGAAPAQLGSAWRILDNGVNVKLYPMCYCTHRAADAMIELRTAANLAAADIASVDVELGDKQLAVLRNHRPQTGLEAKFSLEFAMAASATVGRCTRAELTDDFVRRPEIQDFFAKVRAHPVTERASDDALFAPFDRVRVTLRDGRELTSEQVAYPRGHFRKPVDRERLWEKFADCAADVVRPLEARQLFEALQDLPRLASVRDLVVSRQLAAGAR